MIPWLDYEDVINEPVKLEKEYIQPQKSPGSGFELNEVIIKNTQ